MDRLNLLLRTLAFVGSCALSMPGWAQMVRLEPLTEIGAGGNRTWVDVNNDGRDDYCFVNGSELKCQLSKPTGFVAWTKPGVLGGEGGFETGEFIWSDLDGDGFVDLCGVQNGFVAHRFRCRKGPNFDVDLFQVSYSLYADAIDGYNTYTPAVEGNVGIAKVADVNGDGLADLCYKYKLTTGVLQFRCRIAQLSGGVITHPAATSDWTLDGITDDAGSGWPAGFHDFNGDGLPDYCRILPGGVLNCILVSPAGFAGQAQTSSAVSHPAKEGSAFVDINGDGKVDYCRLDGSGSTWYVRCTMSNGAGWEFANNQTGGRDSRDRKSANLTDWGHQYARWWVDVNGDGLIDYCRVSKNNDVVGNGTTDVSGKFLCRLNRGDYLDGASKNVFALSDVSVDNVNLGRADGGRSFCDATGTGIASFCRVTTRSQQGAQECYEGYSGTVCYSPAPINTHGLFVGLTDAAQANQSLLVKYSDGAGAETRISYMNLSSPEIYTRSNTSSNADKRALIAMPRNPAVYETRVWEEGATSSLPLTGNARYMYRDLRSDPQAGSRGFRERWIFNEGSNSLDHVVFYQGLGTSVDASSVLNDAREIGLVKCQERFAVMNGLVPTTPNPSPSIISSRSWIIAAVLRAAQLATSSTSPGSVTSAGCRLPDQAPSSTDPFILLQSSINTLADTTPANPRFRFAGQTVTKSWDWNGASSARVVLPTATSSTTMDDLGNITVLDQVTTDTAGKVWRKVTTNSYLFGDNEKIRWLLGRLSNATVVTTSPTADIQIAANPRAQGNSPNAGLMTPPSPIAPVPLPLSPEVMAVILQLLLED